MLTTRRFRFALAAAAVAVAAPAARAHADGLPLPVDESPSGVLSHDGASRYLAVTVGDRTAVLKQDAASGAVTSRADLRGRFGIPLVAYDSSAGGLSADGPTLVLIRPRAGFPRRATTFAVMSVRPRLGLRDTVRLRGDFSYDALSPDGRSLFLINYLSPKDPTKYRVRVYDLARHRLDPRAIVDPREAPDEMNGLPLTRVGSPDGRWAYTLYDSLGAHPFIHALDTVARRAVCIDLDGAAFGAGDVHDLRLAVAAGGARLHVLRRGALAAVVDTTTFTVSGPPVARAAAPARDDAGAGGFVVWVVLGGALVAAAGAGAARAVRRGRTRLLGLRGRLHARRGAAVARRHR